MMKMINRNKVVDDLISTERLTHQLWSDVTPRAHMLSCFNVLMGIKQHIGDVWVLQRKTKQCFQAKVKTD